MQVRTRLRVLDSGIAATDPDPGRIPPQGFAAAGLPPLVDGQGRAYSYLRVSVTDRCDFACVYCMPPGGEDDHALRPDLLTFEETARLVSVFGRMGVERVRFTGGEPLVRRDIVRLVDLVSRETGIERLVMTTNGSRLGELAEPLYRAGLRGVNVSLDTLDAQRFRALTRGGDLTKVLAGIHAALALGMEVKLNAVILGGLNEQDALPLVEFAWQHGITPRFIELMPLGEAARLAPERFLDRKALQRRLASVLSDEPWDAGPSTGPARYVRASDGSDRRVGFITAVSEEFCGSCNRVRMTARGELRACLASRSAVSLRDLLRAGASDVELAWAAHCAMGSKLAGHFFDTAGVTEHTQVGMSLIGG